MQADYGAGQMKVIRTVWQWNGHENEPYRLVEIFDRIINKMIFVSYRYYKI